MNAVGNVDVSVSIGGDDITIGELLEAPGRHPSSSLTFRYDGRALRKGYHVTEVKAGTFAGLDCGANPEAWTEIFVQLWDVDDAPDQMTARKFAAIIGKVADHLSLDRTARLTFEVSDGIQPMQLHRAATPSAAGDEMIAGDRADLARMAYAKLGSERGDTRGIYIGQHDTGTFA